MTLMEVLKRAKMLQAIGADLNKYILIAVPGSKKQVYLIREGEENAQSKKR